MKIGDCYLNKKSDEIIVILRLRHGSCDIVMTNNHNFKVLRYAAIDDAFIAETWTKLCEI